MRAHARAAKTQSAVSTTRRNAFQIHMLVIDELSGVGMRERRVGGSIFSVAIAVLFAALALAGAFYAGARMGAPKAAERAASRKPAAAAPSAESRAAPTRLVPSTRIEASYNAPNPATA